jgi:SAM-dependent methyltransferase
MKSKPWEIYDGYDYGDFWKGREYEDSVERIALRKLLPKSGGNLVDLGANYGRLASLYKSFHSVYLTDGAISAVIQAWRLWKVSSYQCVACDLRESPFPTEFFNVVICIRTIHYLPEVVPVFSEVRRLLKTNGIFILEFANKKNLKQILLALFGKSKRDIYDINPIRLDENAVNYHPKFILQLLNQHGFVIEQILGVSMLRLDKLKKLPLPLLTKLDSLLQGIAGLLFLSPSIFIRSRKVD